MLIEQIRADRIQAMKDKDTIKKDLLSVLVGDACKEVKEPDDAKVIATVKKFISNIELTIAEMMKVGKEPIKEHREINILKDYLPKQYSESQLRDIIGEYVSATGANLGAVMKHLKDTYGGQYDGKVASAIAKELVG